MDDDQRIVELKRAYEDVIMNISREAAAKVMELERKSQQLEQELRGTKDEAVQRMLRFKKMMDDKIREAKNTSQNQQEKIDELEPQLQEAEDIANDVRKELRYVQAKYERVTRNDVQHLDKHEIATSEIAFVENRQHISQPISCPLQSQKFSLIASDEENSYLNQRTEYPKGPSQLIQMKNSYRTELELPSIIRRSKKNMFYRNGFTQRIHACERNVLDGELSLSRQPNSVSNKGKEVIQTENSSCNATIYEVDKMFNIGSKEAMHKDDSASCWYDVQAMNLIFGKGKKRSPEDRKNKSNVRKKYPHKLFVEINGTPCDPNRKSYGDTKCKHDPTLIAPKLSSNIAGIPTQPEFAKTTNMNEDNNKGDIGKIICKGESPVDISVPIVQEEGASTKYLDVQLSKLNLQELNEPVQYGELKATGATSEGPSLPVAKRAIEYTFQRRRRRGTVSIAKGNVWAKNNTSVRKKARQNDSAEPKKSSMASDSSLRLYLYGR